jgi:hypothetical protein
MKALSPQASEYVSAWRTILGKWLGWPEPRIQRFIDRHEDDLTAPEGSVVSELFFHDTPIEYVSFLLQPRSLRDRSVGPDDDPVEIEHRIEHAVNQDYAYNSHAFDWDSARRRVERVLAEYGASLPTPDQPAPYEEDDAQIESLVRQAASDFSVGSNLESLELPRNAKAQQLAWTLLRQGKLNVKGYTIQNVLEFPRGSESMSSDPSREGGSFIALVLLTPAGRKVLVFHYLQGWRYWIYDLD